jgi:hypothetical protein
VWSKDNLGGKRIVEMQAPLSAEHDRDSAAAFKVRQS